MRDKNVNDIKYFSKFVSEKEEVILELIDGVDNGLYPHDNIPLAKNRIFVMAIEKLIGMYSMGICLEDLKNEYSRTLLFMIDGGWDEYLVKLKKGRPVVIYDLYELNQYCYMVWMLSLAELLCVPQEQKNKLCSLVKRDKITDELIAGISRIEMPNISTTTCKPFSGLFKKGDFSEINNSIIEKYLLSWYKNTKLLQWHNYKSSIERSKYYFGYWSFESAAIVSILNLDDSSFRNSQYYPKDLVDYYRSTINELPG